MTIITVAAVNTTTNPLWNGPEINWGKNCSGQHGRVDSRLLQDSGGAQQFGDRVVTQERREQTFDRRQVGHVVGHRRGYALLLQPGAERAGQRVGQTGDHQREENADR